MLFFKRQRNADVAEGSPEIPPDEADLIRRCQQGDLAAFDVLFGRYFEFVSILTLRLLGDEELAKDAVQESFTKAWKNIGRFKRNSRFSTWIYRIALNHCIDRLRRMKRDELRTGLSETALDDLSHEHSGAADRLGSREQESVTRRIILQEALRCLPENQRLVITLHIFNEMPTGEIAVELGVTDRTVRNHLRQALERLGHLLKVDGEG